MIDDPKVLICLSASDAWYGRIIRWASRSRVNHTFLLYRSDVWGWFAVEINENGVQLIPPSRLTRVDYLECWRCDEDLLHGLAGMRRWIGAGYDWRGLLSGLVRLVVRRLFGMSIDGASHSAKRLFCSEAAAVVLRNAAAPGSDSIDPPNTSPGDLRRLFRAHPAYHKVSCPVTRYGG